MITTSNRWADTGVLWHDVVWCAMCWYLQDQAESWVHSASQFVEDAETDYTACR